MANLLIEIGNTALKAAWSEGVTLGKTFRYQGEKTMDFILSLTKKEKPEVMVVASTIQLAESDLLALEGECGRLVMLDGQQLSGRSIPAWLSCDRAASIVAARYLFKGKGCTIVDFGTTLTIDFIDADGMYQGGNISLGCRTRFKALNRYSRALPLINTPEEIPVAGHSVASSIEAGVVYGIQFEIERYLDENPENISVFTGGDANYFAKRMKSSIFVISNLVLMGLAIIAEDYVRKNEK